MAKNRKNLTRKQPVFIVAEMSGNHNGDIKRALRLIDEAAKAGVDAIKLQTYTADTITLKSDRPEFQVMWQGKSRMLHDLYQEAYTPWGWHAELFAHAKKRGLVCFSSPFDTTAVEFLETLGNPIYKVASFEVVDIPLLEAIGKTKKPVIMSVGMASPEEIRLAIQTLKKFGTKQITLLYCVSAYPTDPADMNLATIPDMRARFGLPTGLSDHTLGTDVSVASVALGAVAIEKHMTIRRADGGPDSEFSLEPEEFTALVKSVRTVERAIGAPSYKQADAKNRRFRKSLFVAQAMKKGDRFTKENVRSVRPGHGMAPKFYRSVLGKRAARDIPHGEPLKQNLVKNSA